MLLLLISNYVVMKLAVAKCACASPTRSMDCFQESLREHLGEERLFGVSLYGAELVMEGHEAAQDFPYALAYCATHVLGDCCDPGIQTSAGLSCSKFPLTISSSRTPKYLAGSYCKLFRALKCINAASWSNAMQHSCAAFDLSQKPSVSVPNEHVVSSVASNAPSSLSVHPISICMERYISMIATGQVVDVCMDAITAEVCDRLTSTTEARLKRTTQELFRMAMLGPCRGMSTECVRLLLFGSPHEANNCFSQKQFSPRCDLVEMMAEPIQRSYLKSACSCRRLIGPDHPRREQSAEAPHDAPASGGEENARFAAQVCSCPSLEQPKRAVVHFMSGPPTCIVIMLSNDAVVWSTTFLFSEAFYFETEA